MDQPLRSHIKYTSGQYGRDRLGRKGEEFTPSSNLPLFKGSNVTLLNFQIAQGRIHFDIKRQEAGGPQQHDVS